MARDFNGTTGDYLEYAGGIATAPCTIAGWAYRDTDNAFACMLSISETANDRAHRVITSAGFSPVTLRAQTLGPSGSANAESSGTISHSEWFHFAGVFNTSSPYATIYVNGGGSGTSATNPGAISPVRTTLGLYRSKSTLYPWNGKIAWAAVWNAALTAGEVAALGQGYHPLLVRPGALVSSWDLFGNASPEIDRLGAAPLTITGTVTKFESPRIIMPRASRSIFVPAAVVGGANPKGPFGMPFSRPFAGPFA